MTEVSMGDGQMHIVGRWAVSAALPVRPSIFGYDAPLSGKFAYDGLGNLRTASSRRVAGIPPQVSSQNAPVIGLDYFGARYFSGAQGRFTTPDAPFADQHADDPQSWNLYAYGRNNPLSFVDPTGQYVCASSVSKDECANFQKSLDQAQAAADKLKDKYGAKSSQYTSAQRAIDAYGKAGVDNGVAIKVGNTGKYGAQVDVAGTTAAKTADNPSGQNITVTFNTGLLSSTNLGTLVAHEGQHLADGSAWVGSGFSPAMNPLSYQTESNAYQVQAAIGEGMGWQYQTVSFGASPYLLWVQGWPQNNTNNVTNAILRREYNLTPASKRRAYSRATRVRR